MLHLNHVRSTVASTLRDGEAASRRSLPGSFAPPSRVLAGYACGLLLCVLSGIAAAQRTSDSEEAKVAAAFELLAEMAPILEDVRSEIARSRFDRDELLDELDYDDLQIIEFATDHIAFEPYVGLLRGPDGTLRSRAGNALDQAVFLAAMLRDAGFDARLVEGEIDDDDAARLVNGLREARGLTSPFRDDDRLSEPMRRLGVLRPGTTADGQAEAAASTQEMDKVRRVADFLLAGIRDAKVTFGDSVPTWDNMVRDSLRYYWVQYRDSASGEWLDLHPAFGSQSAPNAMERRVFVSEVPEELLHKLRIQAFVSRRVGDQLHETAVMSPWERPVANLVGVTIRYMNFPVGAVNAGEEEDDVEVAASKVRTAIGASRFFQPLLNGELAPGGNAFDLSGNVVPSDVSGSYMAGLFQENAARVGDAIAALSHGRGSDDEVMSLVQHRLQIELIAPGSETRLVNRYLLSPDHLPDDRAVALSREVSISLEPGRPSMAKYLDDLLTQLIAAGQVLEMIDEGGSEVALSDIEPLFETLAALASDTLNRNYLASITEPSGLLGAVSVYRPRPGIVATYRPVLGMAVDPAAPAGFDILSDFNYVWVEDAAAGAAVPLRISPEMTVQLGVLQTMVESFARLPGSVPGSNAFLGWNEADRGRAVVMSGTNDAIPGSLQGLAALRAISSDLDQGYVAVAQAGALTSGRSTWWRIDPRTGETLGMNEQGWGGLHLVPFAEVSLEYKMVLWRAAHMVGQQKAMGALARCNGILATVWMAEQLLAQAAGSAPGLKLALLIRSIGLTLTAVRAAFTSSRGYVQFMKTCVPRMIWK